MKPKLVQLKRATLLMLLTAVLQLLGACSGPSRIELSTDACAKLLETSTQQSLYAHLPSPEQLPRAIADRYNISLDSVHLSREKYQDSVDGLTVIRWQSGDRRYGLDLTPSQLVSFAIGYQQSKPTISDILVCMGPPSAYFAWYGMGPGDSGTWLTVTLYYPKQGAIVVANHQRGLGLQSSSANQLTLEDVARMTIDGIRFSNPTSMDALLVNYIQDDFRLDVRQDPGSQVLAWYKQVIKPWPNDKQELEFSTLHYPELPLLPAAPGAP